MRLTYEIKPFFSTGLFRNPEFSSMHQILHSNNVESGALRLVVHDLNFPTEAQESMICEAHTEPNPSKCSPSPFLNEESLYFCMGLSRRST